MNSIKEETTEMNITTVLVLGSSIFLTIFVHWIFFLIGIIVTIIMRGHKEYSKEVQKWINKIPTNLKEKNEKGNENRLRRIK